MQTKTALTALTESAPVETREAEPRISLGLSHDQPLPSLFVDSPLMAQIGHLEHFGVLLQCLDSGAQSRWPEL